MTYGLGPLLLKKFVVIIFGFIACLFWKLITTGILVRNKIPHAPIYEHKRIAHMSTKMIVLAILITEWMVQVVGRSKFNTELLRHFLAVGFFVALYLITRYWKTGLKDPDIHRVVAYATFLLYVAVLYTGLPMLVRPG